MTFNYRQATPTCLVLINMSSFDYVTTVCTLRVRRDTFPLLNFFSFEISTSVLIGQQQNTRHNREKETYMDQSGKRETREEQRETGCVALGYLVQKKRQVKKVSMKRKNGKLQISMMCVWLNQMVFSALGEEEKRTDKWQFEKRG